MDRGRSARRSLGYAALALLLGGSSAGGGIPIREARWLPPERLTEALTREPVECLAWPTDERARRSVAIGRIAFRAPLLLGGQAARVGLSCASCHRNGRGNRDFLFPTLSGAPGTADVTSSLMSSRRGDRIANPKPIPDLGGPRSLLKIPHAPDGMLEAFIRGLIVEEFDGPDPSAEVLAGLADYVRATRPEACRGETTPIRLSDRLDKVGQAVAVARASKGETRRLLLAAGRSGLGAVDERFQLPGLDIERALLRDADRQLKAIRLQGRDFAGWDKVWLKTRRALLRAEARSLYEEKLVRRMVEREGAAPR